MTIAADNIRSIKSFVRRTGRMTRSQKNAINWYWNEFGIDYCSGPLQIPEEYSSVKLEIGIGNGDALISMASTDADSFYVGIEVHEPGIGRCLNLIQQQGLKNVRLIKHDAIEVLQNMVAAESIDRLLLFFPDPWHKKRHHKRRIVNQQFRDLSVRCLKPGAVLHIATDWQDYADSIVHQLLNDQRFDNQGDADGFAICPDYRPSTRFEQRGRKLGHGVWDLMFVKES